ncbi:hypothetical protein AZ78_1788 [Lysobacter capsici AZ78]|uniref:Uncharacterized protein n=1 Tax=Lysobacter capsici AZ78 TaxID=1444315 RepID=A0A108U806_9GAMM|nr:hypothetical protein AZ78_1788 [Lysobacter capsici AZ78]
MSVSAGFDARSRPGSRQGRVATAKPRNLAALQQLIRSKPAAFSPIPPVHHNSPPYGALRRARTIPIRTVGLSAPLTSTHDREGSCRDSV